MCLGYGELCVRLALIEQSAEMKRITNDGGIS